MLLKISLESSSGFFLAMVVLINSSKRFLLPTLTSAMIRPGLSRSLSSIGGLQFQVVRVMVIVQ
jgi:hypothetical protein